MLNDGYSKNIPALIPKKGKGVYNKNNFFEQVKNKYPELFNKKNYPLQYFHKQFIKRRRILFRYFFRR